MKPSHARCTRGALSIAFALAVLCGDSAGAQPSPPVTREIMGEIVGALQVLLPLSLVDTRFSDPANRVPIATALDGLARNSERLRTHGAAHDASFAFLSGNLAQDASEIRSRFAEGRTSEARFLLQHLTETCVACHSRLPDAASHSLGRALVDDPAIAALPAVERVQLEVATRQFERALASYEAMFADPATPLGELDLDGHFESYLEVCLRVSEDPERAIAQLERLEQRPDLPERLRRLTTAWLVSLRALPTSPRGLPVARAEALVRPTEVPGVTDSASLVPLIAASGILHRAIAAGGLSPAETGRAYYQLGVIESRIGRSFWADASEELLEASIRLGPGEDYADAAFGLLEELVASGYTGSAGTSVPSDVAARMAALQRLIDDAR